MDLLLAHAYFLSQDRDGQSVTRPYPPLGVLYLASHLKRKGFTVGVFDGTFSSLDAFTTLITERRPPVVGLYVNMMTKRHALEMIAIARQAGVKVIVGGPDPPYYADEYLRAGADVVVIGEGEQTLEELIPALHRGSDGQALATVTGIVFRDRSGATVRTPPRSLIADLSTQPHPDRESIEIAKYLDTWNRHHGYRPISLITARGCPYTCTWCSRSVFGTTHRRRTVVDVADEVEAVVARYQPNRLWYADDVFGIHRGWTLDYARELATRKVRLPFECISRAERLDDEVVDAFAELGCWRVWIGSESGSQDVLDAMERRVTVERVREAARKLQRRGIQVGLFIMLGFDGERADDLRATIEHLKRTSPDVFLTTVSYPIKGTPYYEAVSDRLVATHAWADRTDRDLLIRGRPGRHYYAFARRWMHAEVARHQQWRRKRYAGAVRAASSALVGRLGMLLTEHAKDA